MNAPGRVDSSDPRELIEALIQGPMAVDPARGTSCMRASATWESAAQLLASSVRIEALLYRLIDLLEADKPRRKGA